MALQTSGEENRGLLEQILKRLDDSAALGLKRYEEQAAFNAKVSEDFQAVRHQIDLTQADVDDARQLAATGGTTVVQTAPVVDHRAAAAAFVASGLGVPGYPCLANDGAPLLAQPQELLPQRPQPVRQNAEVRHQRGQDEEVRYRRGQDEEHGYVKPPKHDFPRFNGTLPKLWLDRCEAYFDMYNIRPQNWVTTASMYVDGHAALWLQAFRQLNVHVS